MIMTRAQAGAFALVGMLLTVPADSRAQGQGATITGKVTSDAGRPIEGANVYIPELNLSVGASATGAFTIAIPVARVSSQRATLYVRAIGYTPQNRLITITPGTQSFDFSLKNDVTRLSAIVTTGVAGETEVRKVPFAISQIDVASLPVPATNALQALQGKLPGANIVSGSGQPGSAPSVILRAPTSIDASGEGQSPLIIVDGVILNSEVNLSAGPNTAGIVLNTNAGLADISASDIESIEVVRGAAASSLYGARAAKGVIVIRTKSGRSAAEGTRFSARLESGFSDVERSISLARNHAYKLTPDGTRFCSNTACSASFDWNEELAKINNSNALVLTAPSLAPVPTSTDNWRRFQDQAWPGTLFDPVEQATTNGLYRNASADATGRAGTTSYFLSFNQSRQQGSIVGLDGYLRNSFRVNVDQSLGSNWFMQARTYFSRSRDDGNFSGNGFFNLTRMPAIGNILQTDTLGRRYVRIDMIGENNNPVYDWEQRNDDVKANHFLGSANLKYSPTLWLDVESNFAVDQSSAKQEQFIDKGYRTLRTSGFNQGVVYDFSSQALGINAALQATARKSFGTDLATRWQAKYQYEQSDNDYHDITGLQLAVIGTPATENAAQTSLVTTSLQTSTRLIGYFLIGNLEYKGRYILDALVRRDGSSLFGSANRWQTFGRGSVAWLASEEPWFNVPNVSDLKLRYSIGSAGTRPVFEAQYETYTLSSGRLTPQNLGNRDIGPEISVEQEVGGDITLFDRLGLQVNHARTKVREQLMNVPLPAASGFSRQWRNAGTVETRAWEVAATLPIIQRQNLNWTTNVSWDRSRSTITKLNVPDFQYGPPETRSENLNQTLFFAREGERIGTVYGVRYATSCSDLPTTMTLAGASVNTADICAAQFQTNDDGYLVWVGNGNNWTDGITKNLWGTTGPSLTPAAYRPASLMWGAPFAAQDSTGLTYLPLGNTLPDHRWAMANTISWKKLTLYGLLDAAVGQEVYNLGRHWMYFENYSADQDQAGKSDATKKPFGYYGSNTGLYNVLLPNSHFVEDASYVKVRELSVGYTVGRLPTLGGDWTVSVIGRNLKTFTDYQGFDPEVGKTGGQSGSPVINAYDAYLFPNLRTFTLSLRTTF
jgi:TonB-linked SusC/RagA family outer membrane protein